GSNYPQHADNYTVSFEDKNAKTSNYKLVPANGEKATRTYSITRMKVTAPVEQSASASAAKEYTANELSFSISKFDPKYMTYGTLDTDGITYLKGQLPKDNDGNALYSLASAGTTGLTLKATQADQYYVYYQLLTETNSSSKEIVRDYMWSDAKDTDPAPVRKVTYEITPKTLEFTFTSSATNGSWTIKANDEKSKLTYAYAAGKGPATPNGGDTEEPVLEIWFYFTTDGDSSIDINPDNATIPNELLFKNLINAQGKHATGSYTVVIKLADSDKYPVNKNYMTKVDDNDPAAALATYTKAVTISAAEASLDDIKTVYKDSTMGANDDAKELPVTDTAAGTKNLQYVYDESTKKAVEYFITLDFSEISYLQTSGAYTYKYSNGTALAVGSGFAKADTVTVTVNISVKASEQADNKLPAESDYTGTKFKYIRIDDYNGTLTFTYTIDKGDVSEDAIKTPSLQYRYSGESDSEWKDYDPDKLPEYNGKNIEFQIKKPYPTGVTNATIASTGYLGNRKGPGSLSFMVNYDVETNYNTIKTQTYTVTISEQIIDMGSITYDYIRDNNGDLVKDMYGSPYQLPVVKFDAPTLSQYVT
ncbi:MAG: hypothetical protein K2N52_00595, partial [Clostridia bacterium]|nr:hypothetical protein [Clostridia bacterium]